jgi:hypothetical protein
MPKENGQPFIPSFRQENIGNIGKGNVPLGTDRFAHMGGFDTVG